MMRTNPSPSSDHAPERPLWEGKRVLVLGASSGVGAALSNALLSCGAEVTAAARRGALIEERFSALPPDLRARAHAGTYDLQEAISHVRSIERLLGPTKEIDLLIDSAGLIRKDALLSTGAIAPEGKMLVSDFDRVNVIAPVRLMEFVGDTLLRPEGTIVNISSIAAKAWRDGTPFPGEEHYCRTKAELSRKTAEYDAVLQARGWGQRAFALEPGLMRTDEAMVQFPREEFPTIEWDKVPSPDVLLAWIERLRADAASPSIVPIETYRF